MKDLALNRRAFLASSGALVLAIAADGSVSAVRAQEADAAAWVRIEPDGTTRILFPSTEMGQGSSTALPMILAEEMDADWDAVVIEQLDEDDRRFGNPAFGGVLYTAGSSGVYGYYDTLRQAGANARAVLIGRAAERLGVDVAELSTEPGVVVHAASGQSLTYGELAEGGGLDRAEAAPFKDPAEFRLIGSDTPRRDIPAKSTGTETYAIDVRLPDMLHAMVRRAPVEGETVAALDSSAAEAHPGVVQVVTLPDGIAVVAETIWAAMAARDLLDITWTEDAPARAWDDESTLADYAAAAEDLSAEAATWRAEGDAATAIADAPRTVTATYLSDYAYHAQIEPMAVVARVDADGAELWAGTQTQSWTTDTVREVLDLPPERMRIHMMTMGGSFGRRTERMQDYVRDALLCAQATGRPVKVTWTREDDVKHGGFRPAAAQHLQAGLTEEGEVQGWRHRVGTPSVIAYFNAGRWAQVEPQDVISMLGSEARFYAMPDMAAEHVMTERRARVLPWRGIGAAYTAFAAESFIDELAQEAGQDPFTFRRAMVGDDARSLALLDRVQEMSDWDRSRADTALGLSFAGYGDTRVAGVAEVSVDPESGRIAVPRIWAAVDAGQIVSPDNAVNQIEGGIVFGVSSALLERITIRGGEVQQENFYDYDVLRHDALPQIEVHLTESDAPPSAVGEAGTPMVSAAIANGVYALTGTRLRHMPFTPDRVLAAMG
ncbi:xanthine dehydrogenase family protein molybdopterin-binding subunit [Pontivivens ytuae]|uniref:Xanthine dehydrogenase family protein molybdopterin-binding subunit n=1 Tax=Pontivivens ytuae TaxID=2789856 RepID=A0A7S9LST7_9RHOB|nr:molybdopterin cofactor-binding domain-containing protein [Pontivivens ytuae]QPH54654.1 xanthine dehydrogenase family protein molybdopterin-binding subunit [Pontivivens ytuae]